MKFSGFKATLNEVARSRLLKAVSMIISADFLRAGLGFAISIVVLKNLDTESPVSRTGDARLAGVGSCLPN